MSGFLFPAASVSPDYKRCDICLNSHPNSVTDCFNVMSGGRTPCPNCWGTAVSINGFSCRCGAINAGAACSPVCPREVARQYVYAILSGQTPSIPMMSQHTSPTIAAPLSIQYVPSGPVAPRNVAPKCLTCKQELSSTLDAYYGRFEPLKSVCVACRVEIRRDLAQ